MVVEKENGRVMMIFMSDEATSVDYPRSYKNGQINVLTKGKDEILLDDSTCVVIYSIGLIVNLKQTG